MGDRKLLSALGLTICCLLAVTGQAEAQDESAKTHDGFYLQLTGGMGYVDTSVSGSGGPDSSIGGLALDTGIMIGGSPINGLAIGGGFFLDYMPSPSISVDDNEVMNSGITSQYFLGLGMFADFYPDAAGGLHFQGFAGWGGLETSFDGNVGGSDPTGLVITVGGGYDVWVTDDLSAGVMLRLGYGALSNNGTDGTTIAPALLANITYN